MKINAICMVKNEADIIVETLTHALTFCDNIFIFDNGSDDGTSELIDQLCERHSNIFVDFRSSCEYKNQLRNRVYNKHHQQFSDQDWWYILDADEMLSEDPREKLMDASEHGHQRMRVWQAQFYFTEHDLKYYDQEDASVPYSSRRRFYRINWRELRFFKNHPDKSWSESESERVPSFCKGVSPHTPICRHYAERTPDQIQARVNLRNNCEKGFMHVKSQDYSLQQSWLKRQEELFYYKGNGRFKFPLIDKCHYYIKEVKFWFNWRIKNVTQLFSGTPKTTN